MDAEGHGPILQHRQHVPVDLQDVQHVLGRGPLGDDPACVGRVLILHVQLVGVAHDEPMGIGRGHGEGHIEAVGVHDPVDAGGVVGGGHRRGHHPPNLGLGEGVDAHGVLIAVQMEADVAGTGVVDQDALRREGAAQGVHLLIAGSQGGVGGHDLPQQVLPGGEQIVQLLGKADVIEAVLPHGGLGHFVHDLLDPAVVIADLVRHRHAVAGGEAQESDLLLIDLLLLADDIGHLVLVALAVEVGHLLGAGDHVALADQVADGVVVLGGGHVLPADDDAGELHVPFHRVGAQTPRGGPQDAVADIGPHQQDGDQQDEIEPEPKPPCPLLLRRHLPSPHSPVFETGRTADRNSPCSWRRTPRRGLCRPCRCGCTC